MCVVLVFLCFLVLLSSSSFFSSLLYSSLYSGLLNSTSAHSLEFSLASLNREPFIHPLTAAYAAIYIAASQQNCSLMPGKLTPASSFKLSALMSAVTYVPKFQHLLAIFKPAIFLQFKKSSRLPFLLVSFLFLFWFDARRGIEFAVETARCVLSS